MNQMIYAFENQTGNDLSNFSNAELCADFLFTVKYRTNHIALL